MKIPPTFKDLLPLPLETLKHLAQTVGQPQLVSALKDAVEKLSGKDSLGGENIQQFLRQAGRWVESIADPWGWNKQGMSKSIGINGTGELFSSRWTNGLVSPESLPLLAEFLRHPSEAARVIHAFKLLAIGLTGATEVFVAPNVSSAILALGIAEKENRPWILPRIDSVRPFRFGTAAAGTLRTPLDELTKSVIEIGSNHECLPEDFTSIPKLNSAPVLITASHNPARSQAGSTDAYKMLRDWRNEQQGTWIEVLFNGSLHSLSDAPDLAKSIVDHWDLGADVLLVPCDGWLGGPEACLVLTRQKSEWWDALQKVAAGSGLEASGLTYAWLFQLLTATESESGWEGTAAGRFASASLENLRFRAQKIEAQIQGTSKVERAFLDEKEFRVGMGVWSTLRMKSAAINIIPKGQSPSALAEFLATGDHPFWCNVQSDRIEIVLRTMEPDDDRYLVQRLSDGDAPSDERTESSS